MLNSTFNGLQRCHWLYRTIFIRLAVVTCQICEIPWNSPKIRTHSSSRSSKVIHLGANQKCICHFLLVINDNFDRISYRFRVIDAFCSKIACFPHPTLVWHHLAEESLRYQRNLYTEEKYTKCATILSLTIWVYLHSLSCCWPPNMRNPTKFRENSSL